MKVVPIDRYARAPQDGPAGRAGQLMRRCREMACERLGSALPGLMDKVDDALFDLADKAVNNTAQSVYFEAMREVRLKRPGMEKKYRDALGGAIRRAADTGRRSGAGETAFSADEPELMLVENDDLEESLAVTNMATRIRGECKNELFALDRRMAALLGVKELDEKDNPLGPEVLCDAFREACDDIESGIEVRLLVLKLFDRYVVAEIGPLYEDINRYLVQEGILPQIRTSIRRSPSAPGGARRSAGAPAGSAEATAAPAGTGAAAGPGPGQPGTAAGAAVGAGGAAGEGQGAGGEAAAGASGAGQDLFSLLQQLMTVSGGAGEGSGAGEAAGRGPAAGMLAGLTELQQGRFVAPEGGATLDPAAVRAGSTNILRELKAMPLASDMGRYEDGIIDIVAMMFDFILDDRSIPDAMKALIGRLQIPLVKVAMLDRSFFSRRFHPARRLLNALAEAAVGWSERQADDEVLYRTAERVVHRVLDEFEDDVEVFSAALDELEEFLRAEEERAEAQAEESAQAIEAQERLQLAKQAAAAELEGRLEGELEVPALVGRFLHHCWRDLLVVTWFEHGGESEEWQRAVQTMDDLVWSVTPKETAEERNRLLQALPGLIRRLNEGAGLTSMSPEARSGFLSELANYHAAAVRPPAARTPPPAREAPPPAADAGPRDDATLSLDALQGAPDTEEQAAEPAGVEVEEIEVGAPFEEPQVGELTRHLEATVHEANERIHETAVCRAECAGMGTTVVAVLFHGDRVGIVHVGDSRLYRLRGGALEQLTSDHSLVQQLIDQGFYTPEQARESVKKNFVTRALGADPVVKPGVQEQEVAAGDLYLLCSDGLTDLVADDEVQATLETHAGDLDAAAQTLIEQANAAGGKDNISVILVRVRGDGGGPAQRLQFAELTDVGIKRSHNEDAVGFDAAQGLAVLADGMGGCNAGEVASGLAVEGIIGAFAQASSESFDPGIAAPQEEQAAPAARDAAADAPVPEEHTRTIRRMFGPGVEGVEDGPVPPEEEGQAAEEEEEQAEIDPRFMDTLAGDNAPRIEEITLSGDGWRVEPSEPEDDEYTRMVDALEVGAWVEFRREGERAARARLAWISPVTRIYLFTSRTGAKVAQTSPYGLAVELRRGSAEILGDVPLFERVVGQLSARLRGQAALS